MMSLRKQRETYPYGYFCTSKARVSCVYIFPVMQRENEKTTETAVMTAMAKFLSDLWSVDDFRDQHECLSEIFETILLTEMGDDQDLRIRRINSIRTSKMLAETLGSFSDTEINNACRKIMNA